MANEISISNALKVSNGSLGYNIQNLSLPVNQSAARLSVIVQTIGTSPQAVLIGASITPLGIGYIRNADATNYVQIGVMVSGTFYPTHRLKAGEAYIVRLEPTATYYAKANAASVDIEFTVLND